MFEKAINKYWAQQRSRFGNSIRKYLMEVLLPFQISCEQVMTVVYGKHEKGEVCTFTDSFFHFVFRISHSKKYAFCTNNGLI